jgi:hypothetical protein
LKTRQDDEDDEADEYIISSPNSESTELGDKTTSEKYVSLSLIRPQNAISDFL